MRIMGVDPGSLVTGYGVIDVDGSSLKRVTSGVIMLRAADSMPVRLEKIYAGLVAVMKTSTPDEFCIETAFYGKNIQSTLKLGQVRGVAILAAMHHHLSVAEYSPREVKRAVTGTGAAAKQQIEYMVQSILSIEGGFERSDEADGLALAICGAVAGKTAPARSSSKRSASSWDEFLRANPDRIRS